MIPEAFKREKAEIVVVGSPPSRYDYDNGKVMSADTAFLLTDLLEQSGIDPRGVLYLPSYSQAKPYGVKLDGPTLQADAQQHLIPKINEYPRKLIISLGNTAVCALGVVDKPEGVNKLKMQRLKSRFLDGVEIVASMDPYFVLSKPDDNADDFYADLGYARRIYEGRLEEQAPMVTVELKTPQDVYKLLATAQRTGKLACDLESTGLERDLDLVVTFGFAAGEKDNQGRHIVYWWAGWNKLVPRYTDKEFTKFCVAFQALFNEAGKSYRLKLFNANYDLWMIERNLHMNLPYPDDEVMFKKWCINKHGANDLKTNTARTLGYANYDEPVDKATNTTDKRRGLVMFKSNPDNADDFAVLEWLGVEPTLASFSKKNNEQGYRWPEGLSKKFAAWAMLDFEMLVRYQAFDALYTLLLDDEYEQTLEKDEALKRSYEHRRMIGERLLRCEQQGMPLNVTLNREFSKQLDSFIGASFERIQREVVKLDPELKDFNPASVPQLRTLLYGKVTPVPHIDPLSIIENYPRISIKEVKQSISNLHDTFYGDYDHVKRSVESGSYDHDLLRENLLKFFARKYDFKGVDTVDVGMYLTGMYTPSPDLLTKTGMPQCGRVALEHMFATQQEPILQQILMRAKASKLKSTFVDGIFKKIDEWGVLHGEYNVIGTRTGRVSSRKPNCYDDKTEILTKRGWCRFSELSDADFVAQYEIGTTQIEFVRPIKRWSMPYDGQLLKLSSQQIDLVVTPEHRMLLANRKTGQTKVMPATEWQQDQKHFHAGQYVGGTLSLDENLLRLIVAIQADAHITEWGSLDFIFTKKCKITRLRWLLETLNIPFTETDKLNGEKWGKRFKVAKQHVPDYTGLLCNKRFTWQVLELTKPLLNVFVDEIWHWDARSNRHTGYSSTPKINADVVQAALALTGSRARLRHYMPPSGNMNHQIDCREVDYSMTTNVYTEAVPYTGLVYCVTVPSGMVVVRRQSDEDDTYKVSISGNCQNFPGYARGQLIAPLNRTYLYDDLGQAEVRIAAALSQDFDLMEAMYSEDFHKTTAAMVFGISVDAVTPLQRQAAKTLTFGLIYGMGAFKLSQAVGCTFEEAEAFIVKYLARFPKLAAWMEAQRVFARERGWVETAFGTRLHLKDVLSTDMKIQSHALRVACNAPIQGSAGELTFWFLDQQMQQFAQEGWDVKFVNNTHDSSLFDLDPSLAWMEDTGKVDKKGNAILQAVGPAVEIVRSTIENPVGIISPLDTVKFKTDISVSDTWYCEPNLMKALDPTYGSDKQTLPWHILLSDTAERIDDADDRKEVEEIEELEQVYLAAAGR